MHPSLGAELGTNDWLSWGQVSIPQPRIVAREVKSYSQKSASIQTPWLARVGEGRREFGLPKEESVESLWLLGPSYE